MGPGDHGRGGGGPGEAADRDVRITQRLRQAAGQFVSGSELAHLLGVSRAAVSKRIARLRAQGLEIEAVPNRGYRLASGPADLDPPQVTPLLGTRWLGRLYFPHAELTSTNDEATRMAADGAPHGTVVVADRQLEGRGRRGRPWHSPPGVNVYLSAVLRPELAPEAAPPLTLAAAVAVAEGVRGFVGAPPTVKWPNDLLYGGRKLCGILVEMAAEAGRIRHVVLGVGLNVNLDQPPAELSGQVTSLRMERGVPVERAVVLASVLNRLEPWIERLVAEGPAPVVAAWTALADWLGTSVQVAGPRGEVTGVALGLDPSGALRLRTPSGGEELIVSGDVRLPGR